MTAVIMQNYGNNSYLIRQPFDFANRTGKIVFDVDAVSMGITAAFIEIDITEDPVPAPTFREWTNFEVGPTPKSGLMIKWSDNCGTSDGSATTLGNVMVYANYVPTFVVPTFSVTGTGCAKTKQAFLNHFEIDLSQQHIDIYGSDYSTDDGRTFPNFRRIYSANLNVPFTRGYVHVAARNHATAKYGFGPDWVYHWDNIGFDGPVLSNWRAYEIPESRTSGTYSGAAILNLGYQLDDGTTGSPGGIYDPVNRVPSLQFQGVNTSGVVGARLSLNSWFNTITHVANTTWGLTFRFNGGPWHNRSLTTTEVQAMMDDGANGNLGLMIDVPVAELRNGSNALELLPVNGPMDWKPVVANIDLVLTLGAGGGLPASPKSLRIIR